MGEESVSGGDCARLCAQSTGARAEDAFSALALRLHSQLGAGGKSILLSEESNNALARSLRACALDDATYGLQRHEPQFSAAQVVTRGQRTFFSTALLLLAATLVMFPATGGLLLTGIIACGYLANAIFRGLLLTRRQHTKCGPVIRLCFRSTLFLSRFIAKQTSFPN